MEFIKIKGTPCDHSGKEVDGKPKSFELNPDLIAAYEGSKVHLKQGESIIKLGDMLYNNLKLNNHSNTNVI